MKLTHFIWFEKYRPKELDEIIFKSDSEKRKFESYIEDGNIPHLLFYGPPGSGKTTIALILMDAIPCHKLILNASSADRGIDTMKGKVKNFAASQPLSGKIKIVFLDEADALTHDAQRALRNTMETYSSKCRFILTGNNVDRINDAIRSRCTRFGFTTYPKRALYRHLIGILDAEKVSYYREDLSLLVERFYPDIRSIINGLQQGSIDGKFEFEAIENIAFDPVLLGQLLLEGKVKSLRKAWSNVTDFLWLYKFLFDEWIFELHEESRPEAAQTIAEHLYRDGQVIDREINFTSCCIALMITCGAKIAFDK